MTWEDEHPVIAKVIEVSVQAGIGIALTAAYSFITGKSRRKAEEQTYNSNDMVSVICNTVSITTTITDEYGKDWMENEEAVAEFKCAMLEHGYILD